MKAMGDVLLLDRQHTVAYTPKRSRTNEKKTIPVTDILMEGTGENERMVMWSKASYNVYLA